MTYEDEKEPQTIYCQLVDTHILFLYGKVYLISHFDVVAQGLGSGTSIGFLTIKRK